MKFQTIRHMSILGASLAAIAAATPACADEAADAGETNVDAIIVTGTRTTYNNSMLTEQMVAEQPPLASVLDLVDTLPGVQVQEGDAFGFDDWSTTVSIRGFQTNLDQQQVGITIDGLPNGGSNYGGGSKANRFIDTMNIATVEVSQGTADIGSLSNEALGGTLNFVTSDPLDEMRVRLSGSVGDFEASRYYGRVDTGLFLNGAAKAWFSYSHQEATDWIGGSAQNHRDNFAGKFIIDAPVRITGYASYDDAHEDNYDQLFFPDQYVDIPSTDGLTTNWTGVPYQDQAYRRAWSTLRKNFLGYLKAETTIADSLDLRVSAYYHDMAGRGDWVPQYVVDVTADGAGNPESELSGIGTVNGGSPLGTIYFVDANGVSLTPTAGCTGSLTYPYRGTTDASYDPACYPAGAIGAQSYRHTHYRKDRLGFTGDAAWKWQLGTLENTLRGGMWYEDTHRQEWRDWHNVIDTQVGPAYEATPYWTQYSRKYPQDTFKWYAQDTVQFGPVTANFGAKQFINHIDRVDLFGDTPDTKFKSTSDVLLSGGVQIEPMTGLDLFAGYAENFKALTDAVLEFGDADLSQLKPETSENWEAGLRYQSSWFRGSATWFKAKFSNQVLFVSNSSSAGNDYLGEGDGKFFNAGGIDSEGFELLANVTPFEGLNLYGAYTYIDAKYRSISDLDTGTTEDDATIAMLNGLAGNRVAGIPRHMWVLSGSYTYGPVTAGLTGKYTGDRFADSGNSLVAQNYFLTDLNISVKGEGLSDVLKDLEFALTVNNLTDERYLGGISGGYAWIGAPRTAIFTVTADF
ncbi:TonB-dependent receptor domain-containing protein [Novosphingobium pentaromativorans]|uniref:TonB-dependent receptor n=1 Tax=Novosphingobium pentaromativorans US6-1 TaxID=1088721 RepID=G6EG50_9SPHN|nr:TonB-dependent receptor [Novosphingobium pentaromativorans]AIT82261.1 TonB-dependent receptor [Novosphingobium pentaromativorans US6-1]EHJ59739.1 TonB-dependent receptor [Novosphingobium pentaromativorans US6-1]